jgi:hypothetical protein
LTRAREHLVHMPVGLANQLREDCFFWPRAGKVCWAIDTPIALAFLVANNATPERDGQQGLCRHDSMLAEAIQRHRVSSIDLQHPRPRC